MGARNPAFGDGCRLNFAPGSTIWEGSGVNSAEAPVLTRVHGGVATILLNRPEAHNAVTIGLARALHDALSDAAVYADLVVIRGAGGNFCSGEDGRELARLRQYGGEALRPLFESFVGACELIAELPVPVVAAVEGVAMGAGFELVQSVDIAIVSDDAVLATGGSQRLPRIVGVPRALGHLLTGDSLTGRQAAEWGLVYRSVPPRDFENALAGLVANLESKDRDASTRIKQLVRTGLRGSLVDGLRMETEATLVHLAGEGVARHRGRR
jgi:enoyl-CoA hydratase/carnithine racemase